MNHSPPSGAQVNKAWNYAFTPLVRSDTFAFTLPYVTFLICNYNSNRARRFEILLQGENQVWATHIFEGLGRISTLTFLKVTNFFEAVPYPLFR
jgi:hypothetical protein